MLATAVLFLSLGVPCMALGFYFRREAREQATRVERDKQKTRGKKKEKGEKDQAGKERGTSGGASLIAGGLACTIAGLVFLAMWLNR